MATEADAGPAIGGDDRLREFSIALVIGASGYLMTSLIGPLLAGLLAVPIAQGNRIVIEAAGLLGFGISALVVVAVYLRVTGFGWSYLDLRMPTLREVGYVILSIVGLYLLAAGVSVLSQLLGADAAQHSTIQAARDGSPEILLVYAVGAIPIIGVAEELIYRNLVQKRLYRAFSKRTAILLASVLFAGIHILVYLGGGILSTVTSLAVVFGLSVILGGLYARTGTVVVPALTHGIYNLLVFGGQYLAIVFA